MFVTPATPANRALFRALRTGSSTGVEAAIQSGADPTAVYKHDTAIMHALVCANRLPENAVCQIIRTLVLAGANPWEGPEHQDIPGRVPMDNLSMMTTSMLDACLAAKGGVAEMAQSPEAPNLLSTCVRYAGSKLWTDSVFVAALRPAVAQTLALPKHRHPALTQADGVESAYADAKASSAPSTPSALWVAFIDRGAAGSDASVRALETLLPFPKRAEWPMANWNKLFKKSSSLFNALFKSPRLTELLLSEMSIAEITAPTTLHQPKDLDSSAIFTTIMCRDMTDPWSSSYGTPDGLKVFSAWWKAKKGLETWRDAIEQASAQNATLMTWPDVVQHCAVNAARAGSLSAWAVTLRLLHIKPLDTVSWIDAAGKTPLHHCFTRGDDFGSQVRLAEWCLVHGADPNAQSQDGATVLTILAKARQFNADLKYLPRLLLSLDHAGLDWATPPHQKALQELASKSPAHSDAVQCLLANASSRQIAQAIRDEGGGLPGQTKRPVKM